MKPINPIKGLNQNTEKYLKSKNNVGKNILNKILHNEQNDIYDIENTYSLHNDYLKNQFQNSNMFNNTNIYDSLGKQTAEDFNRIMNERIMGNLINNNNN